MAIELVTGLPGHGKTLYTIARLRDRAKAEGRPVFHDGIKGLKLPWPECKAEDWQNLEAGSILVIDEAQRVFPVRGRPQPPKWIEDLAMHRHRGIDLVLITQNPMLIDSFVRRLVDRHFHVVRTFGLQRATVHEFPNGVRQDVERSREGSIRHEWSYDKSVYELYQSAELHTVKRRIPSRVYVLASLPFVLGVLLWFIWSRLAPDAAAERVAEQSGQTTSTGSGLLSGVTRAAAPAAQSAAGSPGPDWLAAQSPRVPGLPHTAPVYDSATAPVTAPYPAACVSTSSRCKCYSQQATVLETPDSLCRSIVERGFFVAWQQLLPQAPGRAASAPAGATTAQTVSLRF